MNVVLGDKLDVSRADWCEDLGQVCWKKSETSWDHFLGVEERQSVSTSMLPKNLLNNNFEY